MSGLGDSPVGLSTPFGVGVPDEAVAPPTVAPEQARFIDPISRDYVVADDGEYQRMPRLRQRVLLALTTEQGSSSVLQQFGFNPPNRIDTTFERRATNSVQSALAFLITAKELHLDAVSVALPRPGRVRLSVSYTDLLTGKADTVHI